MARGSRTRSRRSAARRRRSRGSSGFDVLCFGGTKNGTGGGELVVFFKKELADEFDYRAKQAGQLASKMRFLAAPWAGLLSDGVWLRECAAARMPPPPRSRDKLREVGGFEPAFPREANAVFLRMPRIARRAAARARLAFLQVPRAGHLSADVLVGDD